MPGRGEAGSPVRRPARRWSLWAVLHLEAYKGDFLADVLLSYLCFRHSDQMREFSMS